MDWIIPAVLIGGGLIVAFAGQRIFRFAIAFAGFLLGYSLFTALFKADTLLAILVGVVTGLLLSWLAIKFVKLILYILSFAFIGYAAMSLAGLFGVHDQTIRLIVFVIGGLIGIGLVGTMFNLAVVLVTALGGAAAVAAGLSNLMNSQPSGTTWAIAFILTATAGAIVQWTVLKGR